MNKILKWRKEICIIYNRLYYFFYRKKNTKHTKQKMGTHIWISPERSNQYTVEYPNGNVYCGEMRDGMRWGHGLMMYQRGGNYEGFWKRDRKHGFGKRLYRNGDVYRGNFRKGTREGQGSYRWPDEKADYYCLWKNNEIVQVTGKVDLALA